MKMKDRIIYLVIGALIGAILTAGGFLIFGNNNKMPSDMGDRGQMKQMDGNMTRPEGTTKGNMGSPDGSAETSTNSTNTDSNT